MSSPRKSCQGPLETIRKYLLENTAQEHYSSRYQLNNHRAICLR